MEEGRRMVHESAAEQRSEMQETIKQLKAQIDLSTAMAREAEDETHAFRAKVYFFSHKTDKSTNNGHWIA